MPDVIHCIKNGKGSDSNWELSVEGDKSNLSQFRSARDDPGPIGDRLRKLISQADVINRDRMCSSAPRNLSQPKVAEVMREVDRVVVSLSPEIYLPTKDNCEGTIVSPLAISDGGISHVFVLNTSSEVFEIRLHYPAQPKILASSKVPLRDIQYSRGLLYAVSATRLMYSRTCDECTCHQEHPVLRSTFSRHRLFFL